jgi:LysM repeat protein
MRNSALRRSNLSKEKLAVIEALSRYKQDDEAVNIYVRENKEKELDTLWDSFRVNQKNEDRRSNSVYLATGFIAGAVVTLLLAAVLVFGARALDSAAAALQAPKAPKAPKVKPDRKTININFIPSSTTTVAVVPEAKVYTVAEGDTMEAIVIRYYGSFSLEKQDLIVETNNLTNPNALSIGQKLAIPVE